MTHDIRIVWRINSNKHEKHEKIRRKKKQSEKMRASNGDATGNEMNKKYCVSLKIQSPIGSTSTFDISAPKIGSKM